MSDTTLPHPLPPAEDLSPRQARNLTTAVQTAIGAGTVRETPRVDGYLDRLSVAAQPQVPSQTQRDAARQAAPVAQVSPAAQQARQVAVEGQTRGATL